MRPDSGTIYMRIHHDKP